MELSDIIWQTQTKLFAKDKTSINFSKKQMDPILIQLYFCLACRMKRLVKEGHVSLSFGICVTPD